MDASQFALIKNMAASSIFACAPETLIKRHESAIWEGTGVDDWTAAIMLLREWADYTKNLEEAVKRGER